MFDKPHRYRSRVIESRPLSDDSFELTIERHDLRFTAGRLLTIHGRDPTEDRSYTISSGETEEHLQVLYRRMPDGKLTPQLARLRSGDAIDISGPYGEFVVRDTTRPMVFVATGTGVAPCRSYVRTYHDLQLTLVHGVRFEKNLYYQDDWAPYTYLACVSGEDTASFRGRVTDLCRGLSYGPDTHFYLCGANEMIFDVHALLKDQGVDDSRIFTEAYYYRLDS